MSKKKTTATVYSQTQISEGIFDLWLETDLVEDAKAGQFVSLFCKEGSRLLPRPISICKADKKAGRIRLVYRVAGQGTAEFSNLVKGDSVSVLGVLGNGFPLEEADGKKVIVMGGGIGIPPMLQTCVSLKERGKSEGVTAVLGYRSERFLWQDFSDVLLQDDKESAASEGAGSQSENGACSLYAATEDGSFGTPGNVLDAVSQQNIKGDVIFACGPMPMLRAIKKFAEANNIKSYISLEERMACGVGACLGCVCKTTKEDDHSKVHNSRICTDGPVYAAEDVAI
ncbi:MAG: dihydroorotate dehydrogenase electron transfer subunit [Lachnospiraceae bacterium]|nr:dihydroorotate dehydrogenase electron transfer subunit [Lachnospiraceae bacterium]